MSGGSLTDYKYNLYELGLWADVIEQYNPLLAENMRDLEILLGKYDYWMSGDIGDASLVKAWEEYRDKWLTDSPDVIVEILERKLKECVEIVKGGKTRVRRRVPYSL